MEKASGGEAKKSKDVRGRILLHSFSERVRSRQRKVLQKEGLQPHKKLGSDGTVTRKAMLSAKEGTRTRQQDESPYSPLANSKARCRRGERKGLRADKKKARNRAAETA